MDVKFNVLREDGAGGDPAGAKRRGEGKAEAPCPAPTSAGGPGVEVAL
ncbi:hypothetical protein F4694_002199 [Bacillus niacini]|uniref:Uncharacterized protein n=1 Tax=Neobacillus niacini TaxID=86668 RepID=A0A852TCC4_9BACI|nr:hypothetical protein [Neobacillus niacini]NYE05446.1 hypothetical protein [Neobacillus niacini]